MKLILPETMYMMPTDKQGFFHRYGKKDFALPEEDTGKSVLATMVFVEKLLNTLQLVRKTGLSWAEAQDYWEKWTVALPWKGTLLETQATDSILSLQDISQDLLHKLPQAQLFSRDALLNELGISLTETYHSKVDVPFDPEDINHMYLHYVVFAIKELLTAWDNRAISYIAPLYGSADFEEASFGEERQVQYPNFCYAQDTREAYTSTSLFTGYYDLDGNFQKSYPYLGNM